MDKALNSQSILKPVFWYVLNQKLNQLSKNTSLIHLAVWAAFAGIFLLGISGVERFPKSGLIVAAVFLPSVPAVYLHFVVLDYWFRKKQYALYLLLVTGIVILFGWLIELTSTELVFADDPDAFVSGKLTLLTFLVVSTGLRSFAEGLRAKSKLAEIEAKQTKAELESLRSQVNPHFLFNSLNNIYGQLMENKEQAGESLLTLSSLLRYLIYASQKSSISLEEEVKFLDDYMAMERLRLGEKCQLIFEKEGLLDNKLLSPFLLIPFVENAFKHGSFATVDESYIFVKLQVVGDQLYFEVRNSIKRQVNTESTGTGIANVKRRLELLLPEQHDLTIEAGKNEYVVKLKLQL